MRFSEVCCFVLVGDEEPKTAESTRGTINFICPKRGIAAQPVISKSFSIRYTTRSFWTDESYD